MILTKLQTEYLEYMRKYFWKNDQLPNPTALARQFGVNRNAAVEMLLRLEVKRVIERNEANAYRRGKKW